MIATGTAQWAKILPHQLVTADQYKAYNYWSIDLEVSDKEKKRLIKEGLRPYHKDGETETNIFKFQRKEVSSKGNELGAPTIVDANKNPWGNGEIGNGSQVKISFFAYEHAMTKKFGLGKALNAVQVIDHVAYEGGAGVSEFEAVGEVVEEF
jgi:hypothetical protein